MYLLLILGSAADLGFSMFVWEAVCHSGVSVANKCCFLAIFDMNRWYNAQMPNCIRSATSPFCRVCYLYMVDWLCLISGTLSFCWHKCASKCYFCAEILIITVKTLEYYINSPKIGH